jgi:hypothetical protein
MGVDRISYPKTLFMYSAGEHHFHSLGTLRRSRADSHDHHCKALKVKANGLV